MESIREQKLKKIFNAFLYFFSLSLSYFLQIKNICVLYIMNDEMRRRIE